MLITWLSVAALSFNSPHPIAPLPRGSIGGGGGGHGKIAWYPGTYEEALAEAKSSKKLVFIDFWTTWCGYCKKLDKEAFSSAEVAEVMKGYVCLSVDAESKSGREIARKFTIRGYPSLFFVASDGSIEDSISGWVPTSKFKAEAERVLAGKDTLGSLRRDVEADKANIDKRFRLAQKLEQLGDAEGREAQMAEIRKLDPAGKSLPMRRLARGRIAKVNQGFQRDRSLDVDAVEAFLATEGYPEILFQGHTRSYRCTTTSPRRPAAATSRPRSSTKPGPRGEKAAWANVPEDQASQFGNAVASKFYEARRARPPTRSSRSRSRARPRRRPGGGATPRRDRYVHALDTYACCLPNGKGTGPEASTGARS
jgi:thiol-disulfide isomerase/thioredoxin